VERVKTGEAFVDEADVVISARGTLNDIAWPKLEGMSSHSIPRMHSAAWDDMYIDHVIRMDKIPAEAISQVTTSRISGSASSVAAAAQSR
jgi:hypothetical protein